MRAYYFMVRFQIKKGFNLLKKTKKLANKYQLLLLYKWADHNEKVFL